jgi:hypothetical protein
MTDPLEFKSDADAILERAAERMRKVLAEAASALDPFPPFPGAFFSYGIEIEAPGLETPDRGCVVLAPDGEFYEMQMGQDVPEFPMDIADPVALRTEELKPLELHPQEYLVYAYNAVRQVVELLMERQEEG